MNKNIKRVCGRIGLQSAVFYQFFVRNTHYLYSEEVGWKIRDFELHRI